MELPKGNSPEGPSFINGAIKLQNGASNLLEDQREMLDKDIQIKILNEKLSFALKQLEEKDKQIEHYKQMVKTLKDVLSGITSRGRPQNVPTNTRPAVAPPPGFEATVVTNPAVKKNSIKGRKARSFHYETRHEEDRTQRMNEADRASWRKPSDDEPFVPPAARTHTKIKKSPSQGTLPNLPTFDEENNIQFGNEPSVLSNPEKTPIGSELKTADRSHSIMLKPSSSLNTGPSVSSTTKKGSETTFPEEIFLGVGHQVDKPNKLKKSQSMTNVYTTLEENRLDMKFPELDQLVGQIYALSKYQQGCRFLQKKLDENNAENTKIILNELVKHLVELMTDPFGNYLFSKLMEHCTAQQRQEMLENFLPELLPTAFDMYGTQSMQKMMPFLTEQQIELVVGALKANAIALIKHNKANYLIQYCLDHLQPKHNQWIFEAVVENMGEVSRDRVGCVIVKRCIDHANEEQKVQLIDEISKQALTLVQDPFGNYVVQHVLDKFPTAVHSQQLIANLLGSITELCTQKFSSNVVEKCLKVANEEIKERIIGEITESDMLPQLLSDRFANFVVQTALDEAQPEQRQQLVKNILPHLGRHYSPYTKRLQKKILQV